MTDIDPAKVKREHGDHHAMRGGCCGCSDPDPYQAKPCLPYLLADEVERLSVEMVPKDWHGLMAILNDLYPETIFPTAPDEARRDPGPRIVSLVREVDRLQAEVAAYRKAKTENDDRFMLERDEARDEVDRLRHNYRSLLAIHAAVKMDTPEDQKLHDRAVATFTTALDGD